MNMPVVILFFASILWGTAWIPLKALSGAGIDGLVLTFASYGLLALAFAPVLVNGLRRAAEAKRGWRHLLLIFLFGGGANLAFTLALIYGEVVRVMVLFYLLPVWGVLGGRLFLGEGIDRWRWLGVGFALVGAFLVLGGPRVFAAPPSWLDLLALVSGLLFALNNLVFRAAQAIPVSVKLGAMFQGCAMLAGGLVLLGATGLPQAVTSIAWLGLGAYAFAWLLAANVGSQWGVTHLEAGRASIIIIMELVSAVVSATWVGGETMTVGELLGGTLILIAAGLEAFRQSPPIPAVAVADGRA